MKAIIWPTALLLVALLAAPATTDVAAEDAAEIRELIALKSVISDPQLLPSLTQTLDEEWRQFKLLYKRVYSGQVEESYRRLVWESNTLRALRHNLRGQYSTGGGGGGFTLAANKFADMTRSEFADVALLTKEKLQRRVSDPARLPFSVIAGPATRDGEDPPDRIDWRIKGCVSLVRDQGAMGSASVYGVVGSIEGQLCSHYGHQRAWLSNQQVIDCAQSTESPVDIYAYLASNQGRLDVGIPDTCYPETGTKGPCAFKANCTAAIVHGGVNVQSGNESALQSAVALGPVTVAVDASHASFQLYRSGVYNEPNCSSQNLDHVMLVVGYGMATSGEAYWLVKNSWGSDWGESGYILMSRNRGNQCGIATDASYAIVSPP